MLSNPQHPFLLPQIKKKSHKKKKEKKKDFHFKHVIRVDLVFQHSAHMMQKLYKGHTLWLGDGCWLAQTLTPGWLVAVMTAGWLSVEGSGLKSMRLELCRSKNIQSVKINNLCTSQFPDRYSTQDRSYLLCICHLCLVQSVKPKTQLQHNEYQLQHTEKEHFLMNIIQNTMLGSSTPLVANEGIVEVVVDHEQLLNEPFVHQLGDELHHSSLHVLTHRVQLLLGHTRRERWIHSHR